MREPSREAREAAAHALLHKDCDPSSDCHDCDLIARALDDFAEKRAQRLAKEVSATAGLLAEYISERDALRRDRDDWKARFTQWDDAKCSVEEHIFALSERDALRRQIRDAINALNTDTVTDLTHTQDGTLRMAMQAHLSGVSALRRRVGELEAALLSIRSCFDHFGEWSANAAPMAVCDMPALIDAAVERDSDALAELVTDNERDHWKARAEAAEKGCESAWMIIDAFMAWHTEYVPSETDGKHNLEMWTKHAQEARRARGNG